MKSKDDVYINPLPQMPFNLIKLASSNNRKLNFLKDEENFGDDLSSDE